MEWMEFALWVGEIAGTVAFAAAGGLVAIEKGLDWFGVAVVAVATATGGGVLRDVLLGIAPPSVFRHPVYVLVAVGVAALLVLWMSLLGGRGKRRVFHSPVGPIAVFDAIGLGVFTVSGMDKAVLLGHGGNLFLCVFLGVMTGVGGGLLRDLLVGRLPLILRKELYAVVSIAGGLLYYALARVLNVSFAALLSVGCMVVARLLAVRYRWQLPNFRKEGVQ